MKKFFLGATTILLAATMVTPAFAWRLPKGASLGAQVTSSPTPLTPTGSVTTTRPTFTWTPTAAVSYSLIVLKNGSTVFTKTGIVGTSYTLPAGTLTVGSAYTWKVVRGLATATNPWSSPSAFSVTLPAPRLADLAATDCKTELNSVDFNWFAVPEASSFNFQLKDVQTNVVITTESIAQPSGGIVTRPSTRPGALCSNPLFNIAHTYSWRLQAVAGSLVGPWSEADEFIIFLPPSNLAPSGLTTQPNTILTWSAVAHATEYEVDIIDVTANVGKKATVTGTSWTPTVPLVSGHTYNWRVRARRPFGSTYITTPYLPPTTFTYYEGAPVLLTPTNPVFTTSPTFTWAALPTATYQLQLVDMSTVPVTVLSPGTVAGTSWTPRTPLTAGHTYAWMVLTTTNPVLPSSVGSFTITP